MDDVEGPPIRSAPIGVWRVLQVKINIHTSSSRTCRGRKVPRWNPAPQETLPLRGHPREQQSSTSRPSREAAVAATGSSSSSRSTGPDRGRFWRSQAAQTRLVPAAGRLRRPRQATSHTDTLTDTFTDMENLAEAAPAKYGTRHAGSGRIWACKARLMRTGAEDLAVWRPKARSVGPPAFIPLQDTFICSVASMRQQQQQQ